jgi:hypothetical protein
MEGLQYSVTNGTFIRLVFSCQAIMSHGILAIGCHEQDGAIHLNCLYDVLQIYIYVIIIADVQPRPFFSIRIINMCVCSCMFMLI